MILIVTLWVDLKVKSRIEMVLPYLHFVSFPLHLKHFVREKGTRFGLQVRVEKWRVHRTTLESYKNINKVLNSKKKIKNIL